MEAECDCSSIQTLGLETPFLANWGRCLHYYHHCDHISDSYSWLGKDFRGALTEASYSALRCETQMGTLACLGCLPHPLLLSSRLWFSPRYYWVLWNLMVEISYSLSGFRLQFSEELKETKWPFWFLNMGIRKDCRGGSEFYQRFSAFSGTSQWAPKNLSMVATQPT